MKEISPINEYASVCNELQRIVGKKYWVTNSRHVWITIYKKTWFGLVNSISYNVAKIYPTEPKTISVRDKKLYGVLKKFGETNNYEIINKQFFD